MYISKLDLSAHSPLSSPPPPPSLLSTYTFLSTSTLLCLDYTQGRNSRQRVVNVHSPRPSLPNIGSGFAATPVRGTATSRVITRTKLANVRSTSFHVGTGPVRGQTAPLSRTSALVLAVASTSKSQDFRSPPPTLLLRFKRPSPASKIRLAVRSTPSICRDISDLYLLRTSRLHELKTP